MKKRIFAIVLCLVLCMTVLPVCAFAGEGAAASQAGGSPFTGDESNVVLWIVIAVVALAGLVGIGLYFAKRRK